MRKILTGAPEHITRIANDSRASGNPHRSGSHLRALGGDIADNAGPREVNPVKLGRLTLRVHQVEGVKRLGKADIPARLIGDEMRVGKTPTAIAIDQELRSQVERKQRGNNCTLIVVPKSIISDWATHLLRMGVGAHQVFTVDLPRKSALKKKLGEIAATKRKANARAHYIIVNWDTVSTVRKELISAGPWFHVIGDEIHRIKGRATKRTEAFTHIKCKYRTGLSGTPADNKPEDFWQVLNWLRSDLFPAYWPFVETYCDVQVHKKSGYRYVNGVNHATLPELRRRIEPFYIRRLLKDVADHVPAKQYRTIYVEMGARQRREYNAFSEDNIVGVEGGDILSTLPITTLVRQQQMAIGCCKIEDDGDVHITDSPPSPKLSAIMDYIKDQDESGPFIIFAQHHDTVRLLTRRCDEAGISVSCITGLDRFDDRSKSVARFQSGETDIFIGAIGACREGITLSRANTIIFVDKAWNPSWNRQAEARADALDNCLPVTIVNIECRNSIDEYRRVKIDQKANDTDAITSTR